MTMEFKYTGEANHACGRIREYQLTSSRPELCPVSEHHPPMSPVVHDGGRTVSLWCMYCSRIYDLPDWMKSWVLTTTTPSPGIDVPM